VRGLFPNADELQYIDRARVDEARHREVWTLDNEPLIAGFDVSGGGSAWNVIRFRRGLDGRVMPPVRITGERGRDRDLLMGVCAELLRNQRPSQRIDMLFVDSAFGAPIVERVLHHKNVAEINFGGKPPDEHQENIRAYMYAKATDWLLKGGIPADDENLAQQLCLPGYHINRSGRLVLESKADLQRRGEASPDDADAFVLTFARPVAPPHPEHRPQPHERGHSHHEWMR
jgi:phage terminase large subunit